MSRIPTGALGTYPVKTPLLCEGAPLKKNLPLYKETGQSCVALTRPPPLTGAYPVRPYPVRIGHVVMGRFTPRSERGSPILDTLKCGKIWGCQ